MNKITLAVAAALALGAMPAMAQDSGFYAGVGVGTFNVDINDVEDTLDFDENDTGFRVFGGWEFNQYFGIEAGYDSGAKTDDTIGDIAVDGIEADFGVDVKGFDVMLVGTLPIGETFYAFGKVGMLAWDADLDAEVREDDGEGGVITTTFSDDESGEDFAYGGGFGMNLGENVRAQAEYTAYDISDVDADFISASIIWRFR